jgi:nitrite reductase (NO-forming)
MSDSAELDLAITGFTPSELEVKEGTVELTFNNLDAFPHDVTIDELDFMAAVDANASVSATFDVTPGVYEFYCSIPGHKEAGMVGTLTVLPGAGP